MLASKLKYGDTIGVVGVSNSLKSEENYEKFLKAEQFFIRKGFKIKRAKNVQKDYYGAAGTRKEKAQDIMEMFEDKDVKAIICLTGGETANTIIDLLDYEKIKQNSKIFMGYSDVTVLLQSIYNKTGLVTFSGPNFIDFGEEDAEEKYIEFENIFLNNKIGKFTTGNKNVIREGNIQGKLIGTNLGCMMYLIGTNYWPDMQDKILLIESYQTSPNECQRRFAHLKQVGIFDKIKGIIIGYNYDLQKNGNLFPQMEDILLDYTKEYEFPIIKCNDFGHKIVNGIIPIGVNAKIDTDKFIIQIIDEFLLD